MTIPDHLKFWGKASPASTDILYHPIAYHCLDVTAVFEILFDCYAPANIRWLKQYFLFLVSLHDIGKFTRSFLYQIVSSNPNLWPALLGDAVEPPRSGRHDSVGFRILDRVFETQFPKIIEDGDYALHVLPLIRATTGHHGRPPDENTAMPKREEFCSVCKTQAGEMFANFKELFLTNWQPADISGDEFDVQLQSLTLLFNGWVTISDWIGSTMPYHPPTKSIPDYYDYALITAKAAIKAAGLFPAKVASTKSFEDIFKFKPSPVQEWCETTDHPDGPVCIIIEDDTGEGKTESGLMWAHRIMARGDAKGIYMAMPSKATSNAMYNRMTDIVRCLYKEGEHPSCVLAHGDSNLNDKFLKSITDRSDNDIDYDRPGMECTEWLSSDHRRALLAEIGVGTIDQALLGVMASKFGTMRLAGLYGKVIVLDEIHAYDSYVLALIKKLLTLHAQMGGSVVMLSATLTLAMKQELVAAFSEGLGTKIAIPSALGYPLATIASRSGLIEEHDALVLKPRRPRARRPMKLEIISDFGDILNEIEEAAKLGATVGWVRNTVQSAVDAAKVLRARGLDVVLFHSRFTVGDRADIEKGILKSFGKDSKLEDRRGKVVIATQVIEQSLDLDFDLMVSDPAPLDLLLQRLGRLWRHFRDRPGGIHPRFIIASPAPVDNPAAKWLSEMDDNDSSLSVEKTRFVYPDIALLWRSIRILSVENKVGDPSSNRRMIEGAYTEAAFRTDYKLPFIPSNLTNGALFQESKNSIAKWKGDVATLKIDEGYSGSNWEVEGRIQTRLASPSVKLRLARIVNGAVVPWYQAHYKWAYSEVTTHTINLVSVDNHVRSVIHTNSATQILAMQKTNKWSKHVDTPLVVLDNEEADGWFWTVVSGRNQEFFRVSYHAKNGLKVEKSS